MNLMIDSILVGIVIGGLIGAFLGSIFGWCMAISCVNQRKLIHTRQDEDHYLNKHDDTRDEHAMDYEKEVKSD